MGNALVQIREETDMPYTPTDTYLNDPRKQASRRWESKQKHYSLRISPELWNEIFNKSKSQGISINSYLISLIEEDLTSPENGRAEI